eukprot:CAMPEP_0167779988 /NCGR_PEP_ID=MMETSP0111_2-20121227/5107_1 /TAXON_ID=91324 /ORGANISM="Lotharella globosa, Strain CCCM811" /LENGTH=700 /DNA_ID=CAMNT_0007670449 /DNA_START=15 /DNA_END=2117 /DNA_ORIENTATION=-
MTSGMLTKSHVQLCKMPISWEVNSTKPDTDENPDKQPVATQVFYDTLHEELIKLTRVGDSAATVTISDHTNSTWVECDCGIPDKTVVRMKFSATRNFLALQVNIREVKVVDVRQGLLVAARSCRSHKSRITNVYWCKGPLTAQQFLFVTNTGAELYALKPQGSSLKHLKTVQHQTRYHWFVNSSNWLLVVDLKHIFSLYQVQPKGLTRRCKFELNCHGTNYNAQNEAYYDQISLVEMYNEVMVVYINEQKGKLYILGLVNETMTQKYVYDLYTASKYEVSVIDNVLVVHNMIAKLAVLFDIRTEPHAAIAAPLPIAYDHYEEDKKADGGGSPRRTRAHHVQEHKYDHWAFLPDRYVLDSSMSRSEKKNYLWSMHLDLNAIMHSWPSGKQALLVNFLLKRHEGPSHQLVLGVLRSMIQEATGLQTMSRLFNLMHSVCYEVQLHKANMARKALDGELPEGKSPKGRSPDSKRIASQGYLVISQHDICAEVFRKVLGDDKKGAGRVLPYVIEYARGASRHFLKVTPELNQLMIDLLLQDNRFVELHQYLQYHVLQDSKEFALELISLQKRYEPAYQLGLDMLYRLSAFTEMMKVLLEHDQVLEALQLVPHSSAVFQEKGLEPADFLNVAVKIKRSSIFFTCYRFFQARNQALRNSPVFLPDDRCERFVRIYEKNFRTRPETKPTLDLDDAPTPTLEAPTPSTS